MIGWIKLSRKAAPGSSIVTLPKGTWTEVARITEADVLEALTGIVEVGPAILSAELYGTLPTTRPTEIEARWVRHPENAPDPTKHTGLVVGTSATWEGLVPGSQEYLTSGDFPLVLQIKQSGSPWSLHTIIAVIHAPALYAAARGLVIR